jgi:hypothetical protein
MPVVELGSTFSPKRHFSGALRLLASPSTSVHLFRHDDVSGLHRHAPQVAARGAAWKLILSQHTDGSWPASSTTAFALEARATTELAD